MNEGWASYWHAELFHLYEHVSPDEMIEFARLHAGVVNPGDASPSTRIISAIVSSLTSKSVGSDVCGWRDRLDRRRENF